MYIKKINIKRYGVIENCIIEPEFSQDHSAKPIILAGENGSGKTLLLTNIVDALIELKKIKYSVINEVEGTSYYKLGNKDYIKTGENSYVVNISFQDNTNEIKYWDIAALDTELFITNTEKIEELQLPSEFKETGFCRKTTQSRYDFEKDTILYFPTHRYYKPAWFNKKNSKLEFNTSKDKLIGQSDESFVKVDLLEKVEQWILDVLLDRNVYEIQIEKTIYHVTDKQGNTIPAKINEFKGYRGKNTNILKLINKVLTIIYSKKYDNLEYARIAISQKKLRKISICIKQNEKDEVTIAPEFSQLSSGEVMILSLFATIIREYDSKNTTKEFNLSEIEGIVIIDEIDQNLHIKYAKEVLPILIKSFPKVQFIVTSHSPFFLLGMKEVLGEEFQYINMPNGEKMVDLESFNEINECYKIFVQSHEEKMKELKQIKDKITTITKPLIITEGKTDWKHFKNALGILKEKKEFEELDVEFLEYNEKLKMGESNLESLLQKLSQISQDKKIIGIFDNDTTTGKKYLSETNWVLGHNVYAICIDTPEYRKELQGISVEFLYKDEDLFRKDEEGRRLFISTEFNSINGRLLANDSINYTNLHKIKKNTKIENAKIIDDNVFNTEGKKVVLSKEGFAKNILEGKKEFSNVNVDGFKNLFYKILKVIKEL